MAFYNQTQGPGPSAVYDMDRRRRQDEFERSLQEASASDRTSAQWGQSVQADQRRQDEQEAVAQQLAMTPGVSRGGSTRTRSVADSPLMQGATSSFTRGGQSYSFDPDAAAEQAGRSQATAETTAQSARYDALQKVPGFTPRMAAREVYGRSGIMDIPDPHESRAALSQYMRAPTRENAAKVLEMGGSASIFPSANDFLPNGQLRPPAPTFGSPEYEDAAGRLDEQSIGRREAATLNEIQARQVGQRGPDHERISTVVQEALRAQTLAAGEAKTARAERIAAAKARATAEPGSQDFDRARDEEGRSAHAENMANARLQDLTKQADALTARQRQVLFQGDGSGGGSSAPVTPYRGASPSIPRPSSGFSAPRGTVKESGTLPAAAAESVKGYPKALPGESLEAYRARVTGQRP